MEKWKSKKPIGQHSTHPMTNPFDTGKDEKN